MKRLLLIILSLLLLFSAAAAYADTDKENKDALMAALNETALSDYPKLVNQVKKILYMDIVTVSDEQRDALLNLTVDTDLTFTDKGADFSNYTKEEQETALSILTKVSDTLGLTYTLDGTNDPQGDSSITVNVYKDGVLLGIIDSDAKTDLNHVSYGTLVAGILCILAGLAFIGILAKRKQSISNGEEKANP